jgi:hypothetical protein
MQPMFGNKWLEHKLENLLKAVRTYYSNRLHRLRDIDSLPGYAVNVAQHLTYMTNCPMATVIQQPKTLLCKLWRFCPWCYCRYVVKDSFCRVADAMGCGYYLVPHVPGELIGVVAKLIIPDDADAPQRAREFVRNRNLYRDATQAVGALTYSTVQPAWQQVGRPPEWELSRRDLLVVSEVPDDLEMRAVLPGCSFYYQYHLKNVQRTELASLIGSTLQYPAGLLLYDVDSAARILTATHGLRMSAPTGLFYNQDGPDPYDDECLGYD